MEFAEIDVRFLFEISPHHDFGLMGCNMTELFWSALGEPKRCFGQIPENLIFVRYLSLYWLTEIDLRSFHFILRFSRGAKYRRRIVNERDPNFSHFQPVITQKCGSLFREKSIFWIVFCTVINIQFS